MAIYQEKNKKKITKDGRSWYFRDYYEDVYGNRKQYQSPMYSSKTIAKEKEVEFLHNIHKEDFSKSEISFENIYKEWLKQKKMKVKSSTYYSTKKRTTRHILTYFKTYKLHKIKTNTIVTWIHELSKEKLSVEYQNRNIASLKEILTYAVNNYDFDNKVVAKIQTHKIEIPNTKLTNAEYNYWTYEEFNAFISMVSEEYHEFMYYFLYLTGVRLGEMIALKWNNINWNKKQIKITSTFCDKIDGGGFILTLPKTSNSIRTIDLNNYIFERLKLHYNKEKAIYGFNEDLFIFGNVKHTSPTTFKRYLYQYINKANVKKITPHGFRHSHVSLLIHLGCDSRDVAERIGDTVKVVENTYYHMFPAKKNATVEALNNLNF